MNYLYRYTKGKASIHIKIRPLWTAVSNIVSMQIHWWVEWVFECLILNKQELCTWSAQNNCKAQTSVYGKVHKGIPVSTIQEKLSADSYYTLKLFKTTSRLSFSIWLQLSNQLSCSSEIPNCELHALSSIQANKVVLSICYSLLVTSHSSFTVSNSKRF